MKTKQFETHQGKFVIVDENLYLVNNRVRYSAYLFEDMKTKLFDYELYFGLETATEEQAEMVVKKYGSPWYGYEDFNNKNNWFPTALESLHSLIRSLGIHLYENPIKAYTWASENADEYKKQCDQAESQTFYNPFIFKIV